MDVVFSAESGDSAVPLVLARISKPSVNPLSPETRIVFGESPALALTNVVPALILVIADVIAPVKDSPESTTLDINVAGSLIEKSHTSPGFGVPLNFMSTESSLEPLRDVFPATNVVLTQSVHAPWLSVFGSFVL